MDAGRGMLSVFIAKRLISSTQIKGRQNDVNVKNLLTIHSGYGIITLIGDRTMPQYETRIVWDEAKTSNWQNGLKEDCITIADGDLAIKLLDVPSVVKRAIEQCTNNVLWGIDD